MRGRTRNGLKLALYFFEMRASLLLWFVVAVEWCPGSGGTPASSFRHPIITFETPTDGAVVRSHGEARLPLRATIERLEEGSRVLINLDGQRAEDITHVCASPTCRVEVCFLSVAAATAAVAVDDAPATTH